MTTTKYIVNCLSLINFSIWKCSGLAAATIWTLILPPVKNNEHSEKELETHKMNVMQDVTETDLENEDNELAKSTEVNNLKKLFNYIHFKYHKYLFTNI